MNEAAYRIETELRAEIREEHGRAAIAWAKAIVAWHKATKRAEDRPGRPARRARDAAKIAVDRERQRMQIAVARLLDVDERIRELLDPTRLAGEELADVG